MAWNKQRPATGCVSHGVFEAAAHGSLILPLGRKLRTDALGEPLCGISETDVAHWTQDAANRLVRCDAAVDTTGKNRTPPNMLVAGYASAVRKTLVRV
jgi:hypothetical protein